MLVYIDFEKYFNDGGKAWWSANDVLLPEGFPKGHPMGYGIPPKYLLRIADAYTGEDIVSLPTPKVYEGSIQGGTKVATTTGLE